MTRSAESAVVVTTTLPEQAAALALARTLVEDRLAACVQVVSLSSVYRWQGRVELAEEWGCHVKTTEARLEATLERIKAMHPYEVPELLILPVTGGDPSYLGWVAKSVRDS